MATENFGSWTIIPEVVNERLSEVDKLAEDNEKVKAVPAEIELPETTDYLSWVSSGAAASTNPIYIS